MLKWFNKNKEKKNKGFTLVELIVVIAILAILVGLLAPQYTKYVEKSRKSADVSNLENIVTGFKVAASDHEYKIGGAAGTDTVYQIVIKSGATTITCTSDAKPTNASDYINALKEYTGLNIDSNGTASDLILKSKKWGPATVNVGAETVKFDTTGPAIGAQVKINNTTDAVTVIYSQNVTNYSDTGDKNKTKSN